MKFRKPSGVILEVNENSADYALSLGWEPIDDTLIGKLKKPANDPKTDVVDKKIIKKRAKKKKSIKKKLSRR